MVFLEAGPLTYNVPGRAKYLLDPRYYLLPSATAMTFFDIVLFLAFGVLLYKYLTRTPSNLPLPPGPRGLPILGSAIDMPKAHAWLKFGEWGSRWGPIMSFTALGQRYVLVSDPQIADELLGKSGSLYADRPRLEMASLTGYDRALSAARYGSRFREYRKLIGRVVGTKGSMVRFYPVEDFQATMFLRRVFENPTDPAAATRKTAGAMVLHLTYGYKIEEQGLDPLVQLADEAMLDFADITRPGAYVVEFLPSLRYIPVWFPFFSFQKRALECVKKCDDLADIPLAFCKEQLAKGVDNDSFCAQLLKDESIDGARFDDLKWSAASFYGAGADTTVSVVYCYFLACLRYPEVQRKAQAEIDAVIGRVRLPSFEDRGRLPYLGAVINELYRWLPIVPLAVPHRAMEDNVYRDYYIPKGTYVIANVWKFLHDPEVYPDPFTFNPERFLGDHPAPAPQDRGLFGYGRRICPGNHLADVSVWINVAKAVAGLHVEPALDGSGKPIIPEPEVTDGVISRPVEFKCNVKPRTDQVLQLVDDALRHADL